MQIPKGWQVQSKPVARSSIRPRFKKEPLPGERVLMRHLDDLGISYTHEYKFNTDRKWTCSFRIDETMILVDIDPVKSTEKHSNAVIEGWIVLTATHEQVKSGQCINWIQKCIAKHSFIA